MKYRWLLIDNHKDTTRWPIQRFQDQVTAEVEGKEEAEEEEKESEPQKEEKESDKEVC